MREKRTVKESLDKSKLEEEEVNEGMQEINKICVSRLGY